MMTVSQLMGTARRTAESVGVEPALFQALCDHESGGWAWEAIRYEAAFFDRYIKPMGLKSQTEATARATSWGLGQIMGQVARELGFEGKYLSELLDPEVGCLYAAKKLKACVDKHPADTNAALLAYNGGGNPDYPALVMQHYAKYAN